MRRAVVAILVAVAGAGVIAQQQNRPSPCDPGNGGLTLPQGFCASVVADNVGRTRHIAVSPRGDLYAVLAAAGGRGQQGPAQPAVLAMRDANGDGKIEQVERFGPGLNGTGIGWHDGYLYVGSNTQVVRFKMDGNSL